MEYTRFVTDKQIGQSQMDGQLEQKIIWEDIFSLQSFTNHASKRKTKLRIQQNKGCLQECSNHFLSACIVRPVLLTTLK